MGAYINEVSVHHARRRSMLIRRCQADVYEPNWQETFWGDNYPRLLGLKRLVDPYDVLWCYPCVGSERWKEVGDRLCRV